MNLAPPSGRLATSIRPPWRSTIQAAIARPRPVPPPGSARRPVEALEQVRQVLRPDPGAVVLDHERRRRRRPRATRDADPAVGRAVADGVVDEDHHQLAEPGGIADDDGRLRVDLDPDTAVGGRLAERRGAVGRDVAEVDRHVLELDRARIRAGQQQQVLDDRGHVADLVVDVLERRADRARPARPDGAAGSRRCSGSTVSGVRSSWLASAANSRWRRSAARWLVSDSRIGTSARRA